jgi:glutaredoxin
MEPFSEPALDKFTIYSKSGCPNCVKAKALLNERGIPFITVDCDEYILENKPEFLQFIEKKALTPWKTFPIIFDGTKFVGNKFVGNKFVGNKFVGNKFVGNKFVGNKFVGGFIDLKVYLDALLVFDDANF